MLLDGKHVPVYALDTVIIGSGCAGFNAADWLYDLGRRDIAILTEGVNMGTSRNTGSDKQTYYKLSLASDGADSVREMAETLFSGGSVHGDTALVEAACSVKSFIKLANLGVPFPTNPYGEYVGYKTDHDPRQRATSAGPLTSKYMTECLERSVKNKRIPMFDGMQAIRLLTRENRVEGVLCVDRNKAFAQNHGLTLFACRQIILATGGPAGVYAASVYPESQTGGSGLALMAGAKAANLQEWQYGLASLKFRWNVSGTYQQVLPRYIAVAKDGTTREFLTEYFDTPVQALNMVFLKGYQWPFDVAKVHGSSLIDMIVHHETVDKGNRVFLDFCHEPMGLENGFDDLGEEARRYLQNSAALLPLPITRLEKMNPKAIELYRSHGIDLYREPLEIGVCAQHNNGGLAVDANWQTTVQGLYAAGEAAGTFGVYRPGGSALNSTQVGSMRAAEHIAYTTQEQTGELSAYAITQAIEEMRKISGLMAREEDSSNLLLLREENQKRMSRAAAHIRRPEELEKTEAFLHLRLQRLEEEAKISDCFDIGVFYKNRDIIVSQLAVLSAIRLAAERMGSRGSGLVLEKTGEPVTAFLPGYCYRPGRPGFAMQVLSTRWQESGFVSALEPVRPMPDKNDWFETVWSDYRKRTGR